MQGMMDPKLRLRIERVAAWCGPAFVFTFILFFGYYGHNLPVPQALATNSIPEMYAYYQQYHSDIRFASCMMVVLVPIYYVFACSMAARTWRVEGNFPIWALIEIGVAAIFVVTTSFVVDCFQTAGYQTWRGNPTHIQYLNDLGYFTLILTWPLTAIQMLVTFIAGWADKRPNDQKWIPAWFQWFSFISAISFIPGTFIPWFYEGPLSYNGVLAYTVPYTLWMIWILVATKMILNGINKDIDNPKRHFDICES